MLLKNAGFRVFLFYFRGGIVMKMKKIAAAMALGCLILSATAFAEEAQDRTVQQCFQKDDLIVLDKQDVAGGKGTLHGLFSFTRDMAKPEQAIKEIGWMRLEKGSSIGLHKHGVNEDAYIIISGEGIFTDGDGNETVVHAGDITIARAGQSHALRNEKDEPLIFLDVIAQNDGIQK